MRPTRPSRRRATRKPRCSARWKARQTGRGRGTARGDAREGAGHARHARRDHRRADLREIRACARRANCRPTAKAFSLMALLARPGDSRSLPRPELTGDWEFKLRQMQRGQMSRAEFMQEIADMTRHIVGKAQAPRERHRARRFRHAQGALPQVRRRDSREIQEVPVPEMRVLACGRSWRAASSRFAEAEELIAKRKVGTAARVPQQAGRPFAAVIKLTPRAQARVRFRRGQDRCQRRRGGSGLYRPGAAGQVSEVRQPRV